MDQHFQVELHILMFSLGLLAMGIYRITKGFYIYLVLPIFHSAFKYKFIIFRDIYLESSQQ